MDLKNNYSTRPSYFSYWKLEYNDLYKIVESLILFYIEVASSLEEGIEKINKNFYGPLYGEYQMDNYVINLKDIREYLEEIKDLYINNSASSFDPFSMYCIEVAMDHISKHHLEEYGSEEIVIRYMNAFLEEANYSYITKDENARKIAMKIGIQNINLWLDQNKYNSYEDYFNAKFGKPLIKK